MKNTDSTHAYNAGRQIPPSAFAIVATFAGGLVLSWWMILGAPESGEGPGLFAVCVVFSVIVFGLVALCAALTGRAGGRDPAAPAPRSLKDALPARVDTFTGTLSRRHAAAQILLIPVAIAVGFALLAIVDVVERV